MRRRTLVDLIANNLARDPGDAPTVQLEADVMADDMARYAPTAPEPDYTPVTRTSSQSPPLCSTTQVNADRSGTPSGF